MTAWEATAETIGIVFLSEREETISASKQYLMDLEDELHFLARKQGLTVWDRPRPEDELFADEGLDFEILAELSVHDRGARVKLRLRRTSAKGADLLEHTILLAGERMPDDVEELRREWIHWFWPRVEAEFAEKPLVLADCIWPVDHENTDLSSYLTVRYPFHIQDSPTSERYSIRGVTREELELVCRSSLVDHPLERHSRFVVTGFLIEDGDAIELYIQAYGEPPRPPIEVALPKRDAREALKEIAAWVAKATLDQESHQRGKP